MKKIKITLWLFFALLITQISWADAQTNWDKQLNAAIDYSNAELTNLYLASLTDAGSKTNYPAIKKALSSNSIDHPIDFENLKNLLNDKFSLTLKNLSTPIHEIELQGVNQTSGHLAAGQVIERIKSAIPKTLSKLPDSQKKLDGIQATIESFLNKKIAEETGSEQEDTPRDTTKKPNKNDGNNADFKEPQLSLVNYLIMLFPYILLIALSIFWLKREAKLKQRIDVRKQEIAGLEDKLKSLTNKTDQISSTSNQQDTLNELKRQVLLIVESSEPIKRLYEDITGLSERLDQLKKEPDYQPHQKASQSISSVNTREVPRQAPNVFYMSYPVGNYFSLNARSDFGENTIYRFLPRQNNTEANFEIHTTGGTPVSDLIGGAEQFIKPACIEDNLPSPNTKTIKTLKQGFAVLEGDRWVIKDKALIRYE